MNYSFCVKPANYLKMVWLNEGSSSACSFIVSMVAAHWLSAKNSWKKGTIYYDVFVVPYLRSLFKVKLLEKIFSWS